MSAPNPLIRFTDEQSMLLDTAVSFCRDKSPIRAVRDRLTTELGFERALWDEMVALGWSGIAVPEPTAAAACRWPRWPPSPSRWAVTCWPRPSPARSCASRPCSPALTRPCRRTWLPRLCQGAIGTVALLEPEGDWDLSHVEAGVRRDGDSVHLTASRRWSATPRSPMCCWCRSTWPARPRWWCCPRPTCRRRRCREIVIDETARCARLTLDGLRVPASAVITGAAARASLQAVRNAGLLLASAQAAGGIAGVLDVVVEYLNTRTTFGRKIGSYQSLKHTCADILVGMERARSHVYHAATLLAAARTR
jgi:acyl-CoA dehydrogenase